MAPCLVQAKLPCLLQSCSFVLNCSATSAQDILSVDVLQNAHYMREGTWVTCQMDDCSTDVVVLDGDILHSMLLLQLIGLAKSCYYRR